MTDENKYEFTVKGYVEEMQYGNYSTSIIGLYLTNESYEYLAKDNKDLEVQTISVLSNNGEKSYNEIAKILTDNISILFFDLNFTVLLLNLMQLY